MHLQALGQVDFIHRQHDEDQRQIGETPQLRLEHRIIFVLQRVIEHLVPLIDLHADIHQPERQGDDGDQHRPGSPFLFRNPKRFNQLPDGTFLRRVAIHKVLEFLRSDQHEPPAGNKQTATCKQF
ncbi:hypothetical protein D3C80_1502750 [compost metagenome]